MKIFTIEFVDGKFVKEAREVERDDIKAVLSAYYLHIPVSKDKRKFYGEHDEEECNEVVEDLNNRLVKAEDITGDEFAVITCKDCGNTFLVTPEMAEFYKSRSLDMPVRCKACRAKKKERFKKFAAKG